MPGERVSFEERVELARLRGELGLSFRACGRVLGRAHTTLSREWRADVDAGGRYHPRRAEREARRRRARPKALKLATQEHLAEAVGGMLARRFSPAQCVGRLRRDHPGEPRWLVSTSAIYNAIYVLGRKGLRPELDAALRSGRARRIGRTGTTPRGLPGAVNIAERPEDVEGRLVPGHWEGDLVMGARNASAVVTLVERTSRFLLVAPLPGGKSAGGVATAITTAILSTAFTDAALGLPAQLRRSLTWDNGREMAAHHTISAATGMDVYFADPHSPWQRGTNENANGLLREYFPKGTDFSTVTPEALAEAVTEINDRPRAIHDFASAAEVFHDILTQSLVQ